ncbi:hypothetical protein CLOM_g18371 [Closterium sp. NIES-68]|nr:hypothetical protein CLOM_g18371 [Closterium sp. NIES-68]
MLFFASANPPNTIPSVAKNLSHNPLSGGLDFFLDIHPAPSNSNNKVMDYYRIDVNSCNFSGPFPSFSGDSYLHEMCVLCEAVRAL